MALSYKYNLELYMGYELKPFHEKTYYITQVECLSVTYSEARDNGDGTSTVRCACEMVDKWMPRPP